MKICFVGTGRSGTTLICDMFGNHPELLMFGESYWHPILFDRYGKRPSSVREQLHIVRSVTFPGPSQKRFLRRNSRSASYPVVEITLRKYGLNPASIYDEFLETFGDAKQTVAEFCNSLSVVIMDRLGKSVWGDKTPHYFHKMQMLQMLWPDLVFVHVIRHGIAVAQSMKHHVGFQMIRNLEIDSWSTIAEIHQYIEIPNRNIPILEYMSMWARQILRTRDEASRLRPGSYFEVRFEDLISQTEDVLNSICTFAELSPDSEWVARQEAVCRSDRLTIGKCPDDIDRKVIDVLESLGYSKDHAMPIHELTNWIDS